MTDEDALQFALVGFRTMTPSMQRKYLCGVLDEAVILANDDKIDVMLASQILFRAQMIASKFEVTQPGKLRVVSNNG